jgi:hypothetical protein
LYADWVSAIVATVSLISGGVVLVWHIGSHDGKIDSAIDLLTRLVDDHEDRMRDLESEVRPLRRRSGSR